MRKLKPKISPLRYQNGVLAVEVAVAIIVCAAIGFAIYIAINGKPASRVVMSPPAPSATATPSPDESANWVKYVSNQEPTLSFKYPPAWQEQSFGTAAADNADEIKIASPSGTIISWQSATTGLSDCQGPQVYIRQVDNLPSARGLYLEEIGRTPDQTDYVGVVDSSHAEALTPGPVSCVAVYTAFNSHVRTAAGVPVAMWLKTDGQLVQSDLPEVRQILSTLKY